MLFVHLFFVKPVMPTISDILLLLFPLLFLPSLPPFPTLSPFPSPHLFLPLSPIESSYSIIPLSSHSLIRSQSRQVVSDGRLCVVGSGSSSSGGVFLRRVVYASWSRISKSYPACIHWVRLFMIISEPRGPLVPRPQRCSQRHASNVP